VHRAFSEARIESLEDKNDELRAEVKKWKAEATHWAFEHSVANIEVERLKEKLNLAEYDKLSLKEEVERLKQCLQDIADPLTALRRDLPDGYRLNGDMIIHILNNPATYTDIAKRGLEGKWLVVAVGGKMPSRQAEVDVGMMRKIQRERETERQVRDMDAGEIVDWVHGLEDKVQGLEAEVERLKEENQTLRNLFQEGFDSDDNHDLDEWENRAKRFLGSE